MKHVEACLSAKEDLEGSVYHLQGPVRLVQACLRNEITLQSCLNHQGVVVKQVLTCLRAREVR